jgi:hypothetical protein
MKLPLLVAVIALASFFVGPNPTQAQDEIAPDLLIEADYPGGNILVKEIDGDVIRLAPDLRDTEGWWFYYNFRVQHAAGRALQFEWATNSPMAARGPAVSTDRGQTWSWLGQESVRGNGFVYEVAKDVKEVQFCLAMPYVMADLGRFLEKHRDNKSLRFEEHATSAGDRTIPRLHIGQLSADPKHRVLVTCRHHACEMMASYTLEGLVEEFLTDEETGKWLRENVELLAVPMMDIDGVEQGDQGKNRRPHDHNRDYEGEPIYASVAANKTFVPQWSQGKLRLAMDLHCPWVRGGGGNRGSNEQVYLVGGPNATVWNETQAFAAILERVQTGPLPYAAKHNLPWGESWNTADAKLNRSFSRWAGELDGIRVATTMEIPYATAGGKPVTPDSARALGHDIARAMHRYLSLLDE